MVSEQLISSTAQLSPLCLDLVLGALQGRPLTGLTETWEALQGQSLPLFSDGSFAFASTHTARLYNYELLVIHAKFRLVGRTVCGMFMQRTQHIGSIATKYMIIIYSGSVGSFLIRLERSHVNVTSSPQFPRLNI